MHTKKAKKHEGVADWTENGLQEIQEIHSHVCGSSSERQPSFDIAPISTSIIEIKVGPVKTTYENFFFMLVLHRMCLFSFGFCFDISLIIRLWPWNWAWPWVQGLMYIYDAFHVCSSLCCGCCIRPVLHWFWRPEIGTGSVDLSHLSKLLPGVGGRAHLPKIYC
jgi:hypothetical protein